jgi:hypothetical protein
MINASWPTAQGDEQGGHRAEDTDDVCEHVVCLKHAPLTPLQYVNGRDYRMHTSDRLTEGEIRGQTSGHSHTHWRRSTSITDSGRS